MNLDKSFLSKIELLTPDDQLLLQDGTRVDAAGKMSFQEECKKGAYISDRERSVYDPGEFVVRNAVPVVRNDETVAMLYGVISLEEQSKKYAVDLYEGNAFIQVIDGTNGDVLMDTWHPVLGNLEEMNDRKILIGKSYDTIREKQMESKSGDASFVSKTIGQTMYMHYEPMGINNWSVTLGISENAALKEVRDCTKPLYVMSVIIGVTLVIYTVSAVACQIAEKKSVYKMSITDENTQLLNRSAYEEYLQKHQETMFDEMACIYVDVNDLHEINNRFGHHAGDVMLQTVASCLKRQFSSSGVYRIGGDEFVVFPEKKDRMQCEEKMELIVKELKENSYSIAYGISRRQMEKGLDRLIKEADEKMLENKSLYHAANGKRAPR